MEAVILAGGLGTRLRAVVPDVPKPMAPVGGRPFLEHLMDYWLAQGVDRFILSVGYLSHIIEHHFGSAYRGAPVRYAREATPLGTGGGALLGVAQAADECVLVANGDTFFAVRLDDLRARHRDCAADVTLALRRIPDNTRYGNVVVDESGTVQRFDPAATGGPGIINAGVYLVQRASLLGLGWAPGAQVGLEQELFPELLRAPRRMCGLVCDGAFIDIGVPEDYFRAAEIMAN